MTNNWPLSPTPLPAQLPQVLFAPTVRATGVCVWRGGISERSCLIILLLAFWLVCDGAGRVCCVVLSVVSSAGAKFIDPVGIDPIDPALVKVDEEHHICRRANR